MEKLDIIVTICTSQTTQLVLDELSEYCNKVDVAFLKKTVKCIGQIAIKVEAAALCCVDILVGLVKRKVVICDILRKFPGVFDSIIGTVCQNLESIKEPRAKAARTSSTTRRSKTSTSS
jgi:vesicle coat complex subunit